MFQDGQAEEEGNVHWMLLVPRIQWERTDKYQPPSFIEGISENNSEIKLLNDSARAAPMQQQNAHLRFMSR